MIQTVALLSAGAPLPPDDVAAFVAYWADHYRDVNLGGYICQIAERAQLLHENVVGTPQEPGE